MKSYSFILFLVIFCICKLFAQKPSVAVAANLKWPTLDGGMSLSNNGRYISYYIQNSISDTKTLVLQSTNGKWEREFSHIADGPKFTSDSKCAYFISGKDSLTMVVLGTDKIKHISSISSFEIKGSGGYEYLCLRNNHESLILKRLNTGKCTKYNNVVNEWYSQNEKIMVVGIGSDKDPQLETLYVIDMVSGSSKKIWTGAHVNDLIINADNDKMAFTTDRFIYFYTGSSNPIQILDLTLHQGNLVIDAINRFSRDGKSLFINLKEDARPKKNGIVEIASYLDPKLVLGGQNEVLPKRYLSVIDLINNKLKQLEKEDDKELVFPLNSTSDTLILACTKKNFDEEWNRTNKQSWSLISVNSGARNILKWLDNVEQVQISPNAKFLIYYDNKVKQFFSYEISTCRIRNLTKEIKTSWSNLYQNDYRIKEIPRGIAAWQNNDDAVLIYDQFDIWKIDPLHVNPPINLTNGYGKRNHIIFNYLLSQNETFIVEKNKTLYLSGFDNENKNNGFFLKKLNNNGDPILRKMGPYVYQTNSPYVPRGSNFTPVKAKNANIYIVRRMSVDDAPNYFSTKDFITFIRLSNLQPQKKFTWYATELHRWKSFDGKTLQGILYKPENFDSNKKYPVIFNYYERKSDGLNAYIKPEALCGGCNIDIPTYVSNGYLVFTPDIYYKIGDPMQGTYDAVVSAANYVAKLSFVDARKMGIQGCSWAGLQTNYLITRSNLFAAACTASGASNITSKYGESCNSQNYYETGQGRMGGSLWDNMDLYIKNSPMFSLFYVNTPLLIMHTKEDSAVPLSQALEMFTGLRRLGKKAWLLVYPKSNHGLSGHEADDFSIRMMQFFDLYLKDKPAPIWMTRGVYVEKPGIENGSEFDLEIKIPGPGLLTPIEQAKVDSLMARKPITITLK